MVINWDSNTIVVYDINGDYKGRLLDFDYIGRGILMFPDFDKFAILSNADGSVYV